ncbi:hypothetical protein [Pseudogracilibacillus auburnensis]|nr:hypothetical protein [Pseudogracilibacillus auburnensis]MBO1001528.1 hypothetical protein [Pseudogracilibacillus auburnensis]
MTEQERFKSLLQNIIYETEQDNITSTDELIHLIVQEFQKTLLIASNRP